MSKIIKILKDFDECDMCFNKMIVSCVKGDLFYELETILEENKKNINFVWVDHDKCDNKYGLFLQKIPNKIYDRLCLSCLWQIVSKYNDIPLGDKIPCYN